MLKAILVVGIGAVTMASAAAQSCDLEGKTITAAITLCNVGNAVQGASQCESGRDTIRFASGSVFAEETCTGSSLRFTMNRRLDMSQDRNYLMKEFGQMMSIGATPVSYLEAKLDGDILTLSQDTEFYYRPRGNTLLARMRNHRKIRITNCNACEFVEMEVSAKMFVGGQEHVNYRLKESAVCRIAPTN